VDARESMKRMEALRDERDSKERQITELTSEINKLSNRCEDLLAETRTLRKMANVPANYGINLEQVKLFDREKIDDFKKLIRVL
jgi:predicted RNase H-like nuclease (RuvC/YqgF family)